MSGDAAPRARRACGIPTACAHDRARPPDRPHEAAEIRRPRDAPAPHRRPPSPPATKRARVHLVRRAARDRRARPSPRASARCRPPCAPSGPPPSRYPSRARRDSAGSARASSGSRPRRRTTRDRAASRRGRCPRRAGTMPVASAAAEPPLEPPAVRPVPRVARGAEDRVDRVRAERELRRVGLADRRSRPPPEALHDQRVLGRHVVLEELRAIGGPEAAGRRHVLDRDGHAVQRRPSARAPAERGRRAPGLGQRRLARERDDGVDAWD